MEKDIDLVEEFDGIIEDAPVDFLGTGSDSRFADKEARQWQSRIDSFRNKLIELKHESRRSKND